MSSFLVRPFSGRPIGKGPGRIGKVDALTKAVRVFKGGVNARVGSLLPSVGSCPGTPWAWKIAGLFFSDKVYIGSTIGREVMNWYCGGMHKNTALLSVGSTMVSV